MARSLKCEHMNNNPLFRLRLPFTAFSALVVILWTFPYVARGDDPPSDPEVTSSSTTASVSAALIQGGPIFHTLELPYPTWLGFSETQDAFKFGDAVILSADIEDDHPIVSVVANATGIGLSKETPVPLYMDRSATLHLYEAPLVIQSHADGMVVVHVTATDSLGRSTTLDQQVQLDNTPPKMRIDSISFDNATTSPVFDAPMHISGWVDQSESKVTMTNNFYTLYAHDGSFILRGSLDLRNNAMGLAALGAGPFADFPIKLWLDSTGGFKLAEPGFASSISIGATVRDGAGNTTTVSSAAIAVLQNATSTASTTPVVSGMSNVLFLPGIEASRLYRASDGCDPAVSDCTGHKLWDPTSDQDLSDLFLKPSGQSVRDIYTKEGDMISSMGIFKFYSSFTSQMSGLKSRGTISDWKSVAYDWRLSLDDLLTNGSQHGTHIDYTEASSTPYIESTLRALAATSKTGKVTIIAHSNGGLVAKALMEKLGDAETAKLIDKVILVAVPQSGAPQALAGLLHGYGAALPADWCAMWKVIGSFCAMNASRVQARTFAENAPSSYHLLPSVAYFHDVSDAMHPLISFVGSHLFSKERAAYGKTIDGLSKLIGFSTAQESGRQKPAANDLNTPNILNANLIGYANEVHQKLDAWVPPPSVNVYEIAGWGADTLSGIEYYEVHKPSAANGYVARYRPRFVEDGDQTVPVPSALMLPSAHNVQRYWMDLSKITDLSPLSNPSHATLFEMKDLRDFIQGVLKGDLSVLPDSILSHQPDPIDPKKRLQFTLHGNAEMALVDAAGNKGEVHSNGSNANSIPYSTIGRFAESSYFVTPLGTPYHLVLSGAGSGPVALDVEEMSNGNVIASSTYEGIPGVLGSQATLDLASLSEQAAMKVDLQNDGTTDLNIAPNIGDADSSYVPEATPQNDPPAPPVSTPVAPAQLPQPQQPIVVVVNSGGSSTVTSDPSSPKKSVATVNKTKKKKTAASTPNTSKKISKTVPKSSSVVKKKTAKKVTGAPKKKTKAANKTKKVVVKKIAKSSEAVADSQLSVPTEVAATDTPVEIISENGSSGEIVKKSKYTPEVPSVDSSTSVKNLSASVSNGMREKLLALLQKLYSILTSLLALVTGHA
jgi:hypothetical protein